MLRLLLSCLCAVALTSCGLFTPDVEPAGDAVHQLRAISAARLEKERAIVERITDEHARAAWLQAFQQDAEATDRLLDGLVEWVDAVGDLDWKRLYEDLRKVSGTSGGGS